MGHTLMMLSSMGLHAINMQYPRSPTSVLVAPSAPDQRYHTPRLVSAPRSRANIGVHLSMSRRTNVTMLKAANTSEIRIKNLSRGSAAVTQKNEDGRQSNTSSILCFAP